MCLASRLSTQANLGRMSSKSDIIHMVIGNIALVQVQATVAAFIVAVFAICVGGAMKKEFIFSHAMLLISSSMFTATLSCFVLGMHQVLIKTMCFSLVWRKLILIVIYLDFPFFFLVVVACIDFVLVAVILLSHRFHMNPDNLATPLAASIGDVVSLSVLSFIASTIFEHLGKSILPHLPPVSFTVSN